MLRYETSHYGGEVADATLPGKASKLQVLLTVLETDTGRWDEKSKVLVRTLVQELGKMYP